MSKIAPRERPILFSGEMVRALLAGRKTQTRRIVTVPWRGPKRARPYEPYWADVDGVLMMDDDAFEDGGGRGWIRHDEYVVSPYGSVGDRLWVRETWGGDDCCGYAYRADHPDWAHFEGDGEQPDSPWRPSIFMPRKASRILLEITGVRIERLQDISEEDARAEGVTTGELQPARINGQVGQVAIFDPRKAFAVLWDQINGKRAPCSSNPWVWVLTFRRAGGDE